MRVYLTTMIRLIGFLALALCVVAVGIGRMVGPGRPWRVPSVARHVGLSSPLFRLADGECWFLAEDAGRFERLPLPDGDRLDQASVAPWRDERGESQVVGCWLSRTGDGADRLAQEVGLGRYTFPGGQPLDRLATRVVPISPPCWFPGVEARIVFASGDGRLYRASFEAEGLKSEEERQPRALSWSVEAATPQAPRIGDPCWPSNPSFGDRLLVSLSPAGHSTRAPGLSHGRLWWLRLDADGTRIEAAGPLTGNVPGAFEERMPRLATTPDGGMVLAYLHRGLENQRMELRVAPVRLEPGSGNPIAVMDEARTLARGCLPAPPAISADGLWVSCAIRSDQGEVTTRRLALVVD